MTLDPSVLAAVKQAAEHLRRCGYTVTDEDGNEQPCDRPATGWRWYQDCEHEDVLDVACSLHENNGGRIMADFAVKIERLTAQVEGITAGAKPCVLAESDD